MIDANGNEEVAEPIQILRTYPIGALTGNSALIASLREAISSLRAERESLKAEVRKQTERAEQAEKRAEKAENERNEVIKTNRFISILYESEMIRASRK